MIIGMPCNAKDPACKTDGIICLFGLAEREGFEPPEAVTPQRFSRPPQSTTLPSLRCKIKKKLQVKNKKSWLPVSTPKMLIFENG